MHAVKAIGLGRLRINQNTVRPLRHDWNAWRNRREVCRFRARYSCSRPALLKNVDMVLSDASTSQERIEQV
nr:hypothetical protein CFP56_41288 [Quercus suber]